jgi:hypothetical protein
MSKICMIRSTQLERNKKCLSEMEKVTNAIIVNTYKSLFIYKNKLSHKFYLYYFFFNYEILGDKHQSIQEKLIKFYTVVLKLKDVSHY